jgi:hypothetical protein
MVSRLILFYFALLLQLTVLASVSFGQCRFPSSGTNRLLIYQFEAERSQNATVLHIVLKFQGNAEGVERIDLPWHWDGQSIQARSVHTTISDGPTPESKIIHFPSRELVVLTYDLFKDWNGPFQAPLQFHPIFTRGHLSVAHRADRQVRFEEHAQNGRGIKRATQRSCIVWRRASAPFALLC